MTLIESGLYREAPPSAVVESTAVYRGRFTGPRAWTAEDFKAPAEWTYRLLPRAVDEIRAALQRAKEKGRTVDTVGRADFPVPSFAGEAASLRYRLRSGAGFVVLSGLPPGEFSDEEQALIYVGLGGHLGVGLPQGLRGRRVCSLRDGAAGTGRGGRTLPRRPANGSYRTDAAPALPAAMPDVVGLLALRTPLRGGATSIVSAEAAHNIVLGERPDLLERLYEPFYVDRGGRARAGEPPLLRAPVFTYDGRLSVRYSRSAIRKGYEAAGEAPDGRGRAALDFLAAVLDRPGVAFRFEVQCGDSVWVNNRYVLHARTPPTAWAGSSRRIHSIRVWLKLHG
jgi:hypothetical protein